MFLTYKYSYSNKCFMDDFCDDASVTSAGSTSVEDALRISLDDLLNCEEKGRWWLVGSAWSGRDTDAPTSGGLTSGRGQIICI